MAKSKIKKAKEKTTGHNWTDYKYGAALGGKAMVVHDVVDGNHVWHAWRECDEQYDRTCARARCEHDGRYWVQIGAIHPTVAEFVDDDAKQAHWTSQYAIAYELIRRLYPQTTTAEHTPRQGEIWRHVKRQPIVVATPGYSAPMVHKVVESIAAGDKVSRSKVKPPSPTSELRTIPECVTYAKSKGIDIGTPPNIGIAKMRITNALKRLQRDA